MNDRSPMIARWRQTRKLIQVARMLCELDSATPRRSAMRRRSRAMVARL